MTEDTMYARMSNFVGDATKIVYTGDDGMSWFSVHTFSEDVLQINRNYSYNIFCTVNNGEFGDEIKPFTKYVKARGISLQLFDEGGTNYTPVMTILGLLAFTTRVPHNEVAKEVREMATKSLVNYIIGDDKHIKNARANAALSAPIQELLRKATEVQRVSPGASIAPPPRQVLAFRASCAFSALALTLDPRCRCLLRRTARKWR